MESEVDIGANAELRISSVAATFARPAGRPAPSLSRVVARVGPAGKLWWTPQPLVMLAGSQHRSEVSIKLDATAELLWLEVAVLGRHGEPGGILISRRSLDIAGQPVNRQELRLGTAANGMSGPAVTGGARAVASCLIVHPEWGRERSSSPPRPPSFPEQPTRPRPGLASRPGTTARVAMTPLAAPRAIEILGLAQSVHEIRGGWEMLALQIEDRAPWTSRALRSCMAPSSWPTLGGEP